MQTLIVDDSRTTRAIIARLLQGLGYTTSEAPDGAAALRHLEAQGAPEIAFVDWNMPEMTASSSSGTSARSRATTACRS